MTPQDRIDDEEGAELVVDDICERCGDHGVLLMCGPCFGFFCEGCLKAHACIADFDEEAYQ